MRARLLAINDRMRLAEGFDEALLGVAYRAGGLCVAAYDRSRCIDILAREMGREHAEEYFEFNMLGAWVGDYTPVFVDTRPCE